MNEYLGKPIYILDNTADQVVAKGTLISNKKGVFTIFVDTILVEDSMIAGTESKAREFLNSQIEANHKFLKFDLSGPVLSELLDPASNSVDSSNSTASSSASGSATLEFYGKMEISPLLSSYDCFSMVVKGGTTIKVGQRFGKYLVLFFEKFTTSSARVGVKDDRDTQKPFQIITLSALIKIKVSSDLPMDAELIGEELSTWEVTLQVCFDAFSFLFSF
jgi:hypothetical protein